MDFTKKKKKKRPFWDKGYGFPLPWIFRQLLTAPHKRTHSQHKEPPSPCQFMFLYPGRAAPWAGAGTCASRSQERLRALLPTTSEKRAFLLLNPHQKIHPRQTDFLINIGLMNQYSPGVRKIFFHQKAVQLRTSELLVITNTWKTPALHHWIPSPRCHIFTATGAHNTRFHSRSEMAVNWHRASWRWTDMEEAHKLIKTFGVSHESKSIRAVGWKQLRTIAVSRYNTF